MAAIEVVPDRSGVCPTRKPEILTASGFADHRKRDELRSDEEVERLGSQPLSRNRTFA